MTYSFEETTDSEGGRIVLKDETNELGYVTFEKISESRININHTIVHGEFEGRGYGRILVDRVVKIADENEWEILASCSYAAHVLKK